MTFLITSPLINEVSILILGATIGWKITVIYVLTGISMGIIGGLIMEKLHLEKYLIKNVSDKKTIKHKIQEIKETFAQKLKNALNYSWEIIDKIWPYVLIGVGIGAWLHGFVPQEFFTNYLGKDNLFAVPLATLIGIPLYSNATGIIPVVEVLIAKGLPIGTVFAMMMSVIAISLPELIILRKVMTFKLLIYFVLLMFVIITIIGYFYNLVM